MSRKYADRHYSDLFAGECAFYSLRSSPEQYLILRAVEPQLALALAHIQYALVLGQSHVVVIVVCEEADLFPRNSPG